ncbi:S8 family peptidase [Actinokineospora iranica]|uniref:Subtilase family protein n=1 Tax=Actinokineospora iranica TaxID=1271860 RepID=A0A1G6QAD0_9PSEU|nr:S8 family serine peptidase [Actinokineospora iranica]SDC88625.1 Subtilase family protein [Actinokineospora iranica]
MSHRLRAIAVALTFGMSVAMTSPAAAGPARPAAGVRAYLVITAPDDTSGAQSAVSANGGSVFASYDAIGVVVAHSSAPDFAAKMRPTPGVQKVGASRTSDVPAEAANPAIPPAPQQSPSTEAEAPGQDMVQIGADKAWAISTGSADVLVGVLDNGVDDQHHELKANFDAAKSVSCAYGRVDARPGAWRPIGDHGTHVAGTIAAAKNGAGMIGVAPGVKIASVRVAEPGTQLLFPENTVCAFMHAAENGFDITNNSYWTDPWWANCPNDPDQAAILEAVTRAADYATGKGVLNVVAVGNENTDLDAKSTDTMSPDDSTPVQRPVTPDCRVVPGELDSSVAVASITSGDTKASYSNISTRIVVAAPGNAVYSTVAGGGYAQNSGTSMASPHVAGVAALLKSVDPAATPADLRARLGAQADDLPCGGDSRCKGTAAKNNFYGDGRVDALAAVQTQTG